jgi:hypothetical protein
LSYVLLNLKFYKIDKFNFNFLLKSLWYKYMFYKIHYPVFWKHLIQGLNILHINYLGYVHNFTGDEVNLQVYSNKSFTGMIKTWPDPLKLGHILFSIDFCGIPFFIWLKSMEKRFQYSMEFHKILFTISIDFHGKFRDGHLTLYKLKPVIIT